MLTPAQVMVRQRWTEALRSGAYKQGKWALQQNGAFCCLGVLGEVLQVHAEPLPLYNAVVAYEGDPQMLRPSTLRLAGLGPFGHLGGPVSEDSHLATLNDQRDFTFDEIADVIDLDTLMQLDGAL